MHIFNSLHEAVEKVNAAQMKGGWPIDSNGTRKLLVSLRALGLVDWIEPKADKTQPPDAKGEIG